jgi:hypothetical protein
MEDNQNIDIGLLAEPDPIGFSFDAPGWSMLLGLLVLVLIWIAVKQYMQYRKNKYRRIAIANVEDAFSADLPADSLVFKIAEILKRVSITSYGRAEVAHLNGVHWLEFLNKKNQDTPVFSSSLQEVFSDTLYMGNKARLDKEVTIELKNASLNWIKKHRV